MPMNQNGMNNYNYPHRLSKTRIYRTYRHMKDRCYRKTDNAYKHYGARGITICDEWLGKDGVCQRNILQVANKEPYNDKGFIRKQAGGYIWRFEKEVV